MSKVSTTKMLAVFRYDKLVCVTTEGSESYRDFLQKNEQIIDDMIADYKKIDNDEFIIMSNYDRRYWEAWRDTPLEEFVRRVLPSDHLHRHILKTEGMEGLMAAIPNKCAWDTYKLAALRMICNRNPDADYKQLSQTITDREIFQEVSGNAHLYTFKEVECRD